MLRVGRLAAYTFGMLAGVALCLLAWNLRPPPAPARVEPQSTSPVLDFADARMRSTILAVQDASREDWLGARCQGERGSGEQEFVLTQSPFVVSGKDRYVVRIHGTYGSLQVLHRDDNRLPYQAVRTLALNRADIDALHALLEARGFYRMRPGLPVPPLCEIGIASLESCVEGRYFAVKASCSGIAEGFPDLANVLEARLRARAGMPALQRRL